MNINYTKFFRGFAGSSLFNFLPSPSTVDRNVLFRPLIRALPKPDPNHAPYNRTPHHSIYPPSHGWAYVPDTGAPIAAMAASTRKRGAPRSTSNRILPNNPSVKQQKATLQRIERLAEDTWSKQTNVRRILASERQFKHWHDEQVAQLVLGGNATAGLPTVLASTGHSRRVSAAQMQMQMQPPPKPSTPRVKLESRASKSSPLQATTVQDPSEEEEALATRSFDPLLTTQGIPKMPSKRLMDALLAEAPLSWDAASARPLENRLPGRHFCVVCGYWGKVRCKRCGERTCGLMECWKGHEGSCAMPAY